MRYRINPAALVAPAVIFLLIAAGLFHLKNTLHRIELQELHSLNVERVTNIGQIVMTRANEGFASLRRMARRWEAAGGTPENLWRQDVDNYISDQAGLKAMEWIGPDYHIRWVEPSTGNRSVVGMDIHNDHPGIAEVPDAEKENSISVVGPIDLAQGYKGLLVYEPLYTGVQFKGYIAGVFNTQDFFASIVNPEITYRWIVNIRQNGRLIFQAVPDGAAPFAEISSSTTVQIANQTLDIELIPTRKFVASRLSHQPETVFWSGLVVALLLALCAYSAFRWKDSAKILVRREAALIDKNDALAASEQRYRMLIDGVKDYAIFMLTPDGNVKSWNNGAQRIKGYAEDEIVGRHFSVFYTPEDVAQGLPVKILYTAETLGKYVGEGQRLRKDGSRFWASVLIEPLHDNHHVLKGFVKIVRDVTEYRQLEQKAARLALDEQKRLADIVAIQRDVAFSHHDLQHAMNLIVERTQSVTGAEGSVIEMLEGDEMVYVAAGGTAARHLGLHLKAAGSLAGLCLSQNAVLKCDDAETDVRVNSEACRNIGIRSMVVVPLLRQQATVGVLKVIASQPYAFSDRHVATLSLLANVLSAALSDAVVNDRLRQSEDTFRSAMQHASIGIALVSPEGHWLQVNRALCDMVGYNEEELLTTDFQTLTHPDDLQADLGHVRRVLAKEIDTYQMEKRYFHKSGAVVPVLLSVSLVWNADGTPKHFISQIQNIADRKLAEAAQEKLMEALASSNTELERFAYVASHDMQEPLRMMSSLSDIVMNDYADSLDDEAKNYLTMIRDSGERMRAMVRDLLNYARIGGKSAEPIAVDGNQELHRALENIGELVREKDASVTADPIPAFKGNAIQIMRLLQNLVGNAIKYQPQGQKPKVHVGAEQDGDFVRLSVQDNGIGIAPEFIDSVFEPFRRLHNWDDIQGTGLGLAVCKKIVENHNGRIWVTSAPGKGSTFSFTVAKNPTA